MDTIRTIFDFLVKNAGELGFALFTLLYIFYKVLKNAKKADISIETGEIQITGTQRSVTGKLDFEKRYDGHFRFSLSIEDGVDPIEIAFDDDSVPVHKEAGKTVIIISEKQLEKMKVGSPLQLKQAQGDSRPFKITKISRK